MRILHITAHMGAGAGKAISGMAISDKTNEHRILLLDKPEKTDHIIRCEQNSIDVIICPQTERMREEVSAADVVVVNWWHHPLLYKMLMDISNIPARLVLWSHVNGLHYPRLRTEFISCFEACMFTSKVSFQNENWSEEEKVAIQEKSVLVYGIGDFKPEGFVSKKSYEVNHKIRVGYVGSLDYAKLHPDFVGWLKAAVDLNKDICFELAGDITEELENDVKRAGISEHVQLLGFRTDIRELLTTWDIFVYLLNPFNFATTENALIEAMASGLPVVVSNGAVERTIIEDGKNGILASNKDVFAKELNRLSGDIGLRKVLGKKARASIIEKYDVEANSSRFTSVMDKVAKSNKEIHDFPTVLGVTPFDWFLSGCRKEEAEELRKLSESEKSSTDWNRILLRAFAFEGIYKGRAKGSVEQYSKYFPVDKRLGNLAGIMRESQEMAI